MCAWRRPLSARSADTTGGRLRICCSCTVCSWVRPPPRALRPSQAPAHSSAAAVIMRSRESVRRHRPPCVRGAGHSRLDRLAPRAATCVSVARALCAGGFARRLELYAPRRHTRSLACSCHDNAQLRISEASPPTVCCVAQATLGAQRTSNALTELAPKRLRLQRTCRSRNSDHPRASTASFFRGRRKKTKVSKPNK